MLYKSLRNKVVIVTGGSGGIGKAIVNRLAESGANVISVYYKNLPLESSENNITWFQVNLEQATEWDKLVSFVQNKFGKIDVLINSAGLLEPGNFLSLQEDQLRKMIDINFTSVITGTHKTLKIMMNQGFGHIINIGSLGGIVPMPYSAVYSATKFALRGFTFSLAEELKGTGIKLSLVTLGSIVTKMLDYEAQDNDTAISFVSKPISPITVANSVLKVIHEPKAESIIPRNASTSSKLLVFSPIIFSTLYGLLHKIGIARKRNYQKLYCDFTFAKGVIR